MIRLNDDTRLNPDNIEMVKLIQQGQEMRVKVWFTSGLSYIFGRHVTLEMFDEAMTESYRRGNNA